MKLEPATTALLVLDLATQTCNAQARPRCVAMVPRAATLLQAARAKHWLVVYTLGGASSPSDILPGVAMLGNEPLVKASPDKFINTDLEKILKDHGIKTVVAVGAASEGAVLHTRGHRRLPRLRRRRPPSTAWPRRTPMPSNTSPGTSSTRRACRSTSS